MNQADLSKPVTLATLRRIVRGGGKFAMLTCYDATTAMWLERAGVPTLLVGDSAANVILGERATTHAPLDFMVTLTAAVKRGAPNCFVIGDMPFLSYQVSMEEAVRNAGRFIVEGNADAVKLEVDGSQAGIVEKITQAGMATIAHIGWQPQRTGQTGVPLIVGKTQASIDGLVEVAKRMEAAGAVMLLIEQCTGEAAEAVVDVVSVPVIGCGAGPACHGQVVVLQDLLGMTDWQPSFAKPMANFGEQLKKVGEQWVNGIADGSPGDHPYQMKTEE